MFLAHLSDLAPGLVLRFQSDLGPYSLTLTWRTKPLGLHFSDDVPIRVTEVLEEAAHLNVEVGDMLVGYGLAVHQLQSVEGRTAKEVLQYIYDHIEVLPDGARFSAPTACVGAWLSPIHIIQFEHV